MKHTILTVSMPEGMILPFLRTMAEFMNGTEARMSVTYVDPSAEYPDTGMRMQVITGTEYGVRGDECSYPF